MYVACHKGTNFHHKVHKLTCESKVMNELCAWFNAINLTLRVLTANVFNSLMYFSEISKRVTNCENTITDVKISLY